MSEYTMLSLNFTYSIMKLFWK